MKAKFLGFVLSVVFGYSAFATNGDIDLIMQNIRQWNVYSPQDSIIQSYLDSMGIDGSFCDINYSDQTNTWQPQIHYYRLLPMAYAYISPQNTFYNDSSLYNKIVLGINYWLSINPHSSNWYHNRINEPLLYGLILIAMRDGEQTLPSSLESQIIQRWRNNGSNPANYTGANKSEMALHWMYFACLTASQDTLNLALNYIFEPVVYSDGEGLQVDNCFLQHGPQLYIGGYGEVMLETVLQTAVCVAGTEYSLSNEKLGILRRFVLDSYSNVIRGDCIHWNAIGRQLARPDFLRYPERRIPIIEKMREIDEDNASLYTQILDRLSGKLSPGDSVMPYHAHLFRGDYALHVRPGFSFSTRMVSSRTCRQESINGENLLGYWLSDGSTVITSSGDEYLDLMPLWNWNKIPGVTAPIVETLPVAPAMSTYGTSEFAGGVNDSIYGCTAYKYYDEFSGVNTGASKGYFFFDDEVVCLGAGINSTHDIVQTTVNQCWGKEQFVVGSDNNNSVMNGDVNQTVSEDYRWVLHDGMGYFFPDLQQVVVENKEKVGNWRWISTMQADREITGKVFTLGIQHPAPVQNGKYSYIVIPNSTTASLTSFASNNHIEILANTDSVQVVYHSQLQLYECIFYRACTFSSEGEVIRSLQPCAMMIRKQDDEYVVHVADPTQSKPRIVVGFKTDEMAEMAYHAFDFTVVDDQYAGMTKDLDDLDTYPVNVLSVKGYNGGCGRWAFIASPIVGSIAPIAIENLIDSVNEYDLYRFNQSATLEWQNYKAHTDKFDIVNGQGYLYANTNDVDLVFAGVMNDDDEMDVDLEYDANAYFKGWNLVGNPLSVAATVDRSYYMMNDCGTAIEAQPASAGGTVAACTGIVVQADGLNETITFSKPTRQKSIGNGYLEILLANEDKAIVSFNQGDQLEKYYFGEQNANIYIPQKEDNYAIVYSDGGDDVSLNLKVNKMGEYNLAFNLAGVELDYLHLIDNLTGEDINLLSSPSYTFIASKDDYASRFKLVFNPQTMRKENDIFAYVTNGEIIVRGEGTVQLIDITGRVVSTHTGDSRITTEGMVTGVYIIRIIGDDEIRTQKIVIK